MEKYVRGNHTEKVRRWADVIGSFLRLDELHLKELIAHIEEVKP